MLSESEGSAFLANAQDDSFKSSSFELCMMAMAEASAPKP
jgi:hypothetical protein